MKYLILVLQLLLQIIYSQENNSKFVVDKLAEGFQFVEGPLWMNGKLLFSDIPANTIYEWTPEKGISEFLNPSGNSNGLALDPHGNLLIAQHGKRRLLRLNKNGTESVLASHYNGKRLNSPNDITVHSDGSIFFTDPPYGIKPEDEELGFYGIYKLLPTGNSFYSTARFTGRMVLFYHRMNQNCMSRIHVPEKYLFGRFLMIQQLPKNAN